MKGRNVHATGSVSCRARSSMTTRKPMGCRFVWTMELQIGHGNGGRAGWRAISMSSSSWIGSGRRALGLARRNQLARHPADAGVLSADRSRQRVAAGTGMLVRAQRDGPISRRGLRTGRRRIHSTAAWTSCWRTSRRCLAICVSVGSDRSVPNSMSCCMILDEHVFKSVPPMMRRTRRSLATAATNVATASAGHCADRDTRGLPLAYGKFCRGTPPTRRRCAPSCKGSRRNMARRNASG